MDSRTNKRDRAYKSMEDEFNRPSSVDDYVKVLSDRISTGKLAPAPKAEQSAYIPVPVGNVNPLGMMDRDKAFKELANTKQQIDNEEDANIKEKLESFGESSLTEREQERLRNMPGLRQLLMGK